MCAIDHLNIPCGYLFFQEYDGLENERYQEDDEDEEEEEDDDDEEQDEEQQHLPV